MASLNQPPRLSRRIAHFDLDTFFVAVERLDDPSLIGKPVLVGHDGGRGVVASASYESRTFGCHSAQPMAQALRLCPEAVVVRPHFERYQELSAAFHERLNEAAPIVESVGIDEAYADLTGLEVEGGGAYEVAKRFRERVRRELGLAVSVCIAGSRTTAKVGSDQAKPDGLLEVPVGGDAEFLAPLPIRELPMVGPRFAEHLATVGVTTIGEAAELDPRWLESRFGKSGVFLRDRSRGIDPTPVQHGGRDARSISREVTFGTDVTSIDELHAVLARHADRVASDLRSADRRARTVTLKLRWTDFTTLTRNRTVERPVRSAPEIAEVGRSLLADIVAAQGMRPVRLIGLGVMNLVEDVVQLSFDDAGVQRSEAVDDALDEIRDRFGRRAIARGARRDLDRHDGPEPFGRA
ncbi:MAG: DNA polymerase IV [Dehalococcoidia bacterium]